MYGEGKPVYPIERINMATGKPFDDGEHILYVNGAYEGVSDIGKLMHDFRCSNADDMNYELMAEKTRFLKEDPKGARMMSVILEEIQNEAVHKDRVRTAKDLLELGDYSYEKIAKISKLTLEEV